MTLPALITCWIELLVHVKTTTKAFRRRSVHSGLFWKPLYWHVKDFKWQSFYVNPQEQTERKSSNRFAHVADVRDDELSKSGGPLLSPFSRFALHYLVLCSFLVLAFDLRLKSCCCVDWRGITKPVSYSKSLSPWRNRATIKVTDSLSKQPTCHLLFFLFSILFLLFSSLLSFSPSHFFVSIIANTFKEILKGRKKGAKFN